MRRLFLRTFLWFWMTVILAIAAILAPNIYFGYSLESKWSRTAPDLLEAASREAVDTFERSGELGLVQYFGQLQREYSVRPVLLRDGEEAIGPHLDGEVFVRIVAQMAAKREGPYFRGTTAAQRIVGASGQTYVLVLTYQRTQFWPVAEIALAILAAVLLFCYLITRHVTAPLFKLRRAAASIAEGRLDTRVSPELGRRSDEIADLARDFDRMAERIESLMAGQKRLLGDVSHELRSPLARLTVALTLAKQGPAAEVPEHLERIQSESRRLDTLIGQLLTLSRIDSGVQGLERACIDFSGLVQEIASDADFEARARSRTVTVERADACAIIGSEEILRSAVENVLRNAVRHTGEGTSVEVDLRREASKAVLSVRDHGAGVQEPLLSEMFLPFRRSPNINANGAGLGLAITARAVRAHGGHVRAANAPEGGLLVEIELPLV